MIIAWQYLGHFMRYQESIHLHYHLNFALGPTQDLRGTKVVATINSIATSMLQNEFFRDWCIGASDASKPYPDDAFRRKTEKQNCKSH